MCWLNGQGGYVLQGLIVQGLVNQRIFMADKGWGRGKGYHLYTRKQKFDCYQQSKGVGCTKINTRLLKAMFLLTYQIASLEGGLQKHHYRIEHLLSEQSKNQPDYARTYCRIVWSKEQLDSTESSQPIQQCQEFTGDRSQKPVLSIREYSGLQGKANS